MMNVKKPRRMARPPFEPSAGTEAEAGHACAASPDPAVKRVTKQSLVLDQLYADGGTTLAAIVDSTGWQAHTARAVLTGLRKKGHAIERVSIEGVTRYRIADATAQ